MNVVFYAVFVHELTVLEFAYTNFVHALKGGEFMNDERRLEYNKPTELMGDAASYFMVPLPLILDKHVDPKRITIFCFFSIRRGLDRAIMFSVNTLAQWMARRPNRSKNGINNKIINLLLYLKDMGYLAVPTIKNSSDVLEAHFNLSKVVSECDSLIFAILYVDEVKEIIRYSKHKSKDTTFNIDITLLVFAWLRMKIFKRRNRMLPEEINYNHQNNRLDDIENRRKKFPEAYDCYYLDIAEELGLSERQVSKAVSALNDIGLIYSEALPRTKNENGDWRTEHTIFTNRYKREKNLLLDAGEPYYSREVRNKKVKINNYINKRGNY